MANISIFISNGSALFLLWKLKTVSLGSDCQQVTRNISTHITCMWLLSWILYKNTQNFPFYHQLQTAYPHQPTNPFLYKLFKTGQFYVLEHSRKNLSFLTSTRKNLPSLLMFMYNLKVKWKGIHLWSYLFHQKYTPFSNDKKCAFMPMKDIEPQFLRKSSWVDNTHILSADLSHRRKQDIPSCLKILSYCQLNILFFCLIFHFYYSFTLFTLPIILPLLIIIMSLGLYFTENFHYTKSIIHLSQVVSTVNLKNYGVYHHMPTLEKKSNSGNTWH